METWVEGFRDMRPLDANLLRLDVGDRDGWSLLGNCCRGCTAVFHPPRARCARCGSPQLEAVRLAKTGYLISYTQVHQASAGCLVPTPFHVGLIHLDDGPIIEAVAASALQGSTLEVGARVRLVLKGLSRNEDGQEIVVYRFLMDDREEGEA